MKARFSPARRAMLVRVGSAALLTATIVYVALIGAALVQQAQHWPTLHRDRDFPSYYLATRQLLRGADFYSGLQGEALSLGIADYFIDLAVTPPTFIVVILPLALFSYPVAWGIWQVLSLAALVLSLYLAVRELRWSLSLPRWICLGCAVLLFPPLGFHLLYAHTELFLLLLLTGSWLYLRRGRDVAGGVLLGLAGAIRIYPLFLLIYLLRRRAWKALAAALGSGLGLAVLGALIAGPSSYLRYLTVLQQEVPKLYPLQGNCSLWGDVYKVASLWPALGQQPLLRDALAVSLSLGVLALTLWLTRKLGSSPASQDQEYGLFVVASLLASPLSWRYYQVLLYLPLLVLLDTWQHRAPVLRGVLVVTLATAFAPLIEGQPGLPDGGRIALNFFPSLTLIGVYLALILSSPPAADRAAP